MSDETILTDFCAICHVNAIKYTCPRCGIHTCSLPCVKKHKAWAQCSGERNPAEYRKRADLATPASIDKDFNFITNVERSISRADENILDRGINLAPARLPRLNDARPKWEIEAEERRIKIVKAPKGLTRNKQNKTQWNSQLKCITWTVEWICPDGEKFFAQCPENRLVEEAFLNVVGKKGIKRKRRSSKENGPPNQKIQKQSPASSAAKSSKDDEHPNGQEHQNGSTEAPTAAAQFLADHCFYLHKPNTPSKLKCLIPISASQYLREIVDGRTFVEFPTVYVKYDPPEQLSLPFVTEDEYQKQYGADIPIEVMAQLEEGEVEDSHLAVLPTTVDTQKVLEVLARDMAG